MAFSHFLIVVFRLPSPGFLRRKKECNQMPLGLLPGLPKTVGSVTYKRPAERYLVLFSQAIVS